MVTGPRSASTTVQSLAEHAAGAALVVGGAPRRSDGERPDEQGGRPREHHGPATREDRAEGAGLDGGRAADADRGPGGQLTGDGAEQDAGTQHRRRERGHPAERVDPLTEHQDQDCRHPSEQQPDDPPAPGVPGDLDDPGVLVDPDGDDDPAHQRHEQPHERHRHRQQDDRHDNPRCID